MKSLKRVIWKQLGLCLLFVLFQIYAEEIPGIQMREPRKIVTVRKESLVRKSRDDEDEISMEYKISHIDPVEREIVVQLTSNTDIHSTNYYEIDENGHLKNDSEFRHCFYTGKVKDYNDSFVVASLCNGITGLIHINGFDYHIKPINYEDLSRRKKRQLYNERNEGLHYITGENEGAEHETEPCQTRKKNEESFEIDERLMTLLESALTGRNFEMNVDVIGGKGITKERAALIMSIVNYLYTKSNLGFSLKVKMSSYTSMPWMDRKDGDVLLDNIPRGRGDTSLYLTGLDLDVGGRSAIGYATVDSLEDTLSAVIVEGNHKRAGYIATHELAHNLGADHDGENGCIDFDFIMATRQYGQRKWSDCSRKQLKYKLLTSKQVESLEKYESSSESLYSGLEEGEEFEEGFQFPEIEVSNETIQRRPAASSRVVTAAPVSYLTSNIAAQPTTYYRPSVIAANYPYYYYTYNTQPAAYYNYYPSTTYFSNSASYSSSSYTGASSFTRHIAASEDQYVPRSFQKENLDELQSNKK